MPRHTPNHAPNHAPSQPPSSASEPQARGAQDTARVVIIGGGPAGAAAACFLARKGYRVTLTEAREFPRPKVCGEFISQAGLPALHALLSAQDLRNAGARAIDALALDCPHPRGDRSIAWRTPAPAVGLSRATLDHELLARARAAGVDVRQPAHARGVDFSGERPAVTLATGETLHADVVIHADNSGRFDPAGPTPIDRAVVGLKCHLRLPAAVQGVRIRAGRGAYVGLITVEQGLSTCAFVAKASLVKQHRGDLDALLASLWPAYYPAQRAGEWMTCPVPRSRYTRPGHPRCIRLGNAAAAVDPVGGEGIGNALWSAQTFAEAMPDADAFSLHALAAAERTLARAYARRLRWRLPVCRAASWAVMHEPLVRTLWPLLAWHGGANPALRLFYLATGKAGV